MRIRHRLLTTISLAIAAAAAPLALLAAPVTQAGSTTTVPPVYTTTTYGLPAPYNPTTGIVPPSTDNYHCSLIDPHLAQDVYVTRNRFIPDQVAEIHHAILFLITGASQIAQAKTLDTNSSGNGWSCFGAPLSPTGSFDGTPWLGAWVPGHGATVVPSGTGILMPAGSLIVMQIHYNLLAGSTPDQSQVKLTTTPAAGSTLKPLSLYQLVAPPDLPCPTGVTGPLCNRAKSIADLDTRFGTQAGDFVNLLETICNHNYSVLKPSTGQVGTKCTYIPGIQLPAAGGVIRAITPHMHLLGMKAVVTLRRASGYTSTLLTVPYYNFDSQVTYNLATPKVIHPGDSITIHCSYDPTLRQKLPQLKTLAPRYVTWGDGSSDEMCLDTLAMTAN